MEIRQNKKDGSADIIFTWKEVWTLIKRRKLHLDGPALRHFGNILIAIISTWQANFHPSYKNKFSYNQTVTPIEPDDKKTD
tara:strand:+ start:162 stop:404 length:243 start_codon:yes stop_codon:yes gene_type:complete